MKSASRVEDGRLEDEVYRLRGGGLAVGVTV